ncbi:MAG: hypothetical protein HOE80_04090 [Candidatus Magasanikbacteria bacterium]|jgi:hypothetical protein|nr:hypothetical protein [Candidatus Magasanikbacteria bacterium]MBT4071874.1 hypothetical protein [Candidatus Magasanikbacteria bacterium]
MKQKSLTIREKKQAIKRLVFSTSFRIGLVGMIMCVLVLNVMQTAVVSTKGYDINTYEKQILKLEQENRKLDVQIAKHRSMVSIQERLSPLGLVNAQTPEYVTLVGSTMAQR